MRLLRQKNKVRDTNTWQPMNEQNNPNFHPTTKEARSQSPIESAYKQGFVKVTPH